MQRKSDLNQFLTGATHAGQARLLYDLFMQNKLVRESVAKPLHQHQEKELLIDPRATPPLQPKTTRKTRAPRTSGEHRLGLQGSRL